MSRSGWLAILMIGCGHPGPAPTPPKQAVHAAPTDAGVDAPLALDDDLPQLAARSVQMYQDFQRALAEAGIDCAAATAKVNAVADRYADVIVANGRVLHAGRDKVKRLRAALEPHQAELDEAGKAISQSPAMTTCAHDAAFAHAIDRIGGES